MPLPNEPPAGFGETGPQPAIDELFDLLAARKRIDALTAKLAEVEAAVAAQDNGHKKPCYYCDKPCNDLAGNPGKWSIPLCHPDEPGVVKFQHIGCVSERLEKLAKSQAQVETLNEECNSYSESSKLAHEIEKGLRQQLAESAAREAELVIAAEQLDIWIDDPWIEAGAKSAGPVCFDVMMKRRKRLRKALDAIPKRPVPAASYTSQGMPTVPAGEIFIDVSILDPTGPLQGGTCSVCKCFHNAGTPHPAQAGGAGEVKNGS